MSKPNKDADMMFQLWFDLRNAARQKDFDKFSALLDKNADQQLTSHPFLTECFYALANEGNAALLKTMFDRGYKADPETLAETLKQLAKYHYPKAAEAMAYLVAGQAADTQETVYWAAAHGRLDVLQTIDAAGGDVRAGDSGFFLALYGGHPAVMNYLFEKGADIYHPNMIAACYGRTHEIPETHRKTALQTYRDLVEMDNATWAECYAEAGGAADTMSAFRLVPNALGRAPMSLLQLAVRADKFADVVAVAEIPKAFPLTAQDLLTEDFKGVTPLMIMAARGKLGEVFDPNLWQHRPEEVQVLHDALKKMRAEKTIDLPGFAAEMDRARLRTARQKAPRLQLKPRGR